MQKNFVHKGIALIEIVIGTAVLSIVFLTLMTTFTLALTSALAHTAKVQATFLEEEGLEAVRIIRDDGWNVNIASQVSGVNFYLAFDAGTWKATTTNRYIDNLFERKVVFADVFRDNLQNIVSSGGTLDANTKKVTVLVSWSVGKATTTKSLSTYLTNIFNN